MCRDYRSTDAYNRPLTEPLGVILAVLDVGRGTEPGMEVRLRRWRRLYLSKARDLARASYLKARSAAGRTLRRLGLRH